MSADNDNKLLEEVVALRTSLEEQKNSLETQKTSLEAQKKQHEEKVAQLELASQEKEALVSQIKEDEKQPLRDARRYGGGVRSYRL